MKLTLTIWRQDGPKDKGHFEKYQLDEVSEHMSFLEMLDDLNEKLVVEGKDPIAFDHDCREGICGTCSLVINGTPHGPRQATTTCQLHMREFNDGDTICIEPWRAAAFPVIRDLVIDRRAMDRIINAGGYISVNTGNAPEANSILVPRQAAEQAFDAAACIGCGACVAGCPNSAAMLFTAAKIDHLSVLPQGVPEMDTRALRMVAQMEEEAFGSCTNYGVCEAVCPKEISIATIARLNRRFTMATLRAED